MPAALLRSVPGHIRPAREARKNSTESGSSATPTPVAVLCRMDWKYSGNTKSNPYMPNVINPASGTEAEKARFRKTSRGTSGRGLRCSTSGNSAMLTRKATAHDRITGERQPKPGPSMNTSDRLASAVLASACPPWSRFPPLGSRSSGTEISASVTVATATGTMIQKRLRHPSKSISTPPSVGPIAIAKPFMPPQMAIAPARRRESG